MTTSRRRIAAALGTAAAWGLAWAPIAVLVGTTLVDPDNSMDEMWLAIGAFPGFICGVLFSVLLAVAARGRSAGAVDLPQLALLGALAGLAVALLPVAIGGEPRPGSLDLLSAGAIVSFTLMGAASALVTGLVLRSVGRRQARRA